NCTQLIGQSNVINIVGSKVTKLSATQKNSVEGLCIMQSMLDSSVTNEVQQELLDKIKNNLQSSGGLLGSPAKNNLVSKTITENSANIDNSKFNQVTKNCLSDIRQENILNIIGSEVNDANFDQVNDSFLKCLADHSDITKITTDTLAKVEKEQETEAVAESGDVGESLGTVIESAGTAAKDVGSAVKDVATGFTSWIMYIVIAVVVVAIISAGIYVMDQRRKSK
ncbi:MAG: hypothetical protein RIR48_2516, partial [Bacteroidota bacterium]